MSDGALVRQALAGQPQAYEQLVRRWAARITAFCHARVSAADAAEELAQEALVRGYVALRSLAEPEKFGSWLCGIALRVCFDWLKLKKRPEVSLDALTSGDDGDATDAGDYVLADDRSDPPELDDEDRQRLLAEVERLPVKLR